MGQYTDGRFQTRQNIANKIDSNLAATGVCAIVRFFTQSLVYEVAIGIGVAGTAAATSKFDIYKNTSSIGAVVFGTETADQVVIATLADTTFAANDRLVLKNSDSDATFKGNLSVDYSELFSAT
jgi:hypothetical protein